MKVEEIKRVIKATDLSAKILAPIHTLSRGYKQRVGVAQAILGKPKLLILDEPTNGLDPEQTQHMRQLIKDIAQDATVIISTHIMQEVNALCDRVLILKSGQVVLDEKLADLQHSKLIAVDTNFTDIEQLNAISGVKQVDVVNEHSLLIEISKQDFVRSLCSDISKVIINAEADLFSIAPKKQDLETLFNQINNDQFINNVTEVNEQHQGVSHAA